MDGKVETQAFGAGGYGGMGGYGGFAPFGLFGILGLNNRGFGNDGDNCLGQRFTDAQIAGVNQNITTSGNTVTNAIYDAQAQNRGGQEQLANMLGNGFDRSVDATRTAGEVLSTQISGNKDAIQNAMFQQALFGKDFALSQCAQTTELKNEIVAQGESTRALINANTVQDLRDANAALQTKYDFASRGLFEGSGPFIDTFKPCSRKEQDIDQINIQIQNGLANIANQMPSIVAAEVAKYSTTN